jgi:hypothetical protein
MVQTPPRPRGCYCRPGETHCGACQVCGRPGHTCHFPGPLPYTGSWCDEHYTIIYDRMAAALDPEQPYALRDEHRTHYRSPGRRGWLWRRGDAFLMEFRSQWLARYVAVAPSGRPRWRQERWDHPLSAWLLPLELMRGPTWQPVTAEEFERAWAAAGEVEANTGNIADRHDRPGSPGGRSD